MNELLLAARENTPRLFPAQMVDLDEMIQRAGVCMPMDRSAIPMLYYAEQTGSEWGICTVI